MSDFVCLAHSLNKSLPITHNAELKYLYLSFSPSIIMRKMFRIALGSVCIDFYCIFVQYGMVCSIQKLNIHAQKNDIANYKTYLERCAVK